MNAEVLTHTEHSVYHTVYVYNYTSVVWFYYITSGGVCPEPTWESVKLKE